jgi:hypothetical protein
MALYTVGGQLLTVGGQLATDSDCCCGECDNDELRIFMESLTASLTVTYDSCTPVTFFEDCNLNSVAGLTVPLSGAIGTLPVSWFGTAVGRGGSYKCNASIYRITGLHTVGVYCLDSSTVRIVFANGAASSVFPDPQALLDVPFSSFNPTDLHVLTPQSGSPCTLTFCSVTWF